MRYSFSIVSEAEDEPTRRRVDDVGGVELVDVLGYGMEGKAIGVSRFWVLAGQQRLNDEESKKRRKVTTQREAWVCGLRMAIVINECHAYGTPMARLFLKPTKYCAKSQVSVLHARQVLTR